jgi:DNA ligase 1
VKVSAVKSGSIPLMLAHTIDKVGQDPKGWLMSEKLDGVRCYWNGKKMYSRNGNEFFPPKWFSDSLPKDIALDGELFTKRADFQRTISIVKKYHTDKATDNDWKEITYMVFDAPLIKGNFS